MRTTCGMEILSAEAMSAAGLSADKLSLQNLQSKMKCDPESYEAELQLIYQQFKSSLELFEQQAAVSAIAADPSVAKDLGEKSLFLAHLTQFYPKHLSPFSKQLADLLRTTARSLPSSLRCQLTQALILLVNRKVEAFSSLILIVICHCFYLFFYFLYLHYFYGLLFVPWSKGYFLFILVVLMFTISRMRRAQVSKENKNIVIALFWFIFSFDIILFSELENMIHVHVEDESLLYIYFVVLISVERLCLGINLEWSVKTKLRKFLEV